MEKESDITQNHQNILSGTKDVFSCVREETPVLCREWELLLSQDHASKMLLRRIVSLVEEYEKALKEEMYPLADSVYGEMRALREEFAISEGYGSYTEYIFENELKIRAERLNELFRLVSENVTDEVEQAEFKKIWADSAEESFEKLISLLWPVPGIGEFLKKLIDRGNVNIYADRDYTLYDESDPFPVINIRLSGHISDIGRFSHELGHAYGIYLLGKVPDIISGEIHACLTEFMIYPYLQDDPGSGYEKWHTSRKIKSLELCSAITEFELTLYGQGADIRDTGKLWQEKLNKYGIRSGNNSRLRNEHLFRFPFYNASYVIAILYSLNNYGKISVDEYKRLMRKEFCEEELFADLSPIIKETGTEPGNKYETKANLRSC